MTVKPAEQVTTAVTLVIVAFCDARVCYVMLEREASKVGSLRVTGGGLTADFFALGVFGGGVEDCCLGCCGEDSEGCG